MIHLNFDNVLSTRVGIKNGLGERFFGKFLEKNKTLISEVFRSKSKMGYAFLELTEDKKLFSEIKKLSQKHKKNKWENIVVLGIGGSSLGAIAVQEAIMGPFHLLQKQPHLFVIDNIDPSYVSDFLNSIDLKKSLFIVISKSGGTTEPMSLYNVVRDRLSKKVKNVNKHFMFITDPKTSILREIGKKEKVEMYSVPPKVGGRFSVLSSVGLIPLALAGVDVTKMVKGAKKMKEEIKKRKGEKNIALQLASIQYLLDRRRKKPMTVMMPYNNSLFRMGDWYRQLLAESIGKNKRTGPTPINALGTTDQHSQLQLYNEGPLDKWIIFLRTEKHKTDLKLGKHLPEKLGFLNGQKMSRILDAALEGTSSSLAKNNRPNVTLTLSKIDEETIGGLFMLFEFQVALLGLLYKVDAFNQPGVEDSKILTKQILSK